MSCTSSLEGDLITDAVALTDCPQKSCAQGIPDESETKILLSTPVNNMMAAGNSFAEVSGDCYASVYPQNYFDVRVTYNGSQVTNFFPSGFTARCNQGKFYFPVSLQGAPNGSYNLTAQLVVIDSQGLQIRPPFKVISTNLIKQ